MKKRTPKPAAKPKRKAGRPRIEFDQAVADRICDQLAEGKSLRRICTQKAMPTKKTVLRWLEENPAFQAQYSRAHDGQAEHYFDELMDLQRQATAENAHAIRVRADIIKWACSKLKPKKYGERTALDIQADVRVQEEVSDIDMARGLAFSIMEEARNAPLEKFIDTQTQILILVAENIAARGDGTTHPGFHIGRHGDLVQAIQRVAEHVSRLKDAPPRLPAPPAPQSEPSTRAREGEPPMRDINPHPLDNVLKPDAAADAHEALMVTRAAMFQKPAHIGSADEQDYTTRGSGFKVVK